MSLPGGPQAQYWQPAVRREEPDSDGFERADRTHLALMLGLASFLCGPVGVVAWWVSRDCLTAIHRGEMDPAGEAAAKAGRLLGVIALCMFAVKVAALTIGLVLFDWQLL